MARAKKKADPIANLGDESKLTVQKSRPLFALWQSELTLAEFKILDTYLGRINSRNPDQRVVTFEKGELEEKLGVTKINQKDLELRLKHLMGNVIKITDNDEKKGFRLITLFEEAEAEQDEYGQWKVNLECTQKAMKYIFNIENIGYFQYKLRCITSITSRYTYILFVYMESHRQMGLSWEISLEELRELLNCTAERYKQFKYFKAEVLERAHKEIHEKTECRYSYEPIKKGRSVIAIRFTLEPKSFIKEQEADPNQLLLFDIEDTNFEDDYLLASACGEEFTQEEMQLILSVLVTVPDYRLPELAFTDSIGIRRYHYLDQKYSALQLYSSRKKITNRFAYFLKMIQQDTE